MALIEHIRVLNQTMMNRSRWLFIIVLGLALILIGFVFSRYWLAEPQLTVTKATPIVSTPAATSASASMSSIPDNSSAAKTLPYLKPLAYNVAITPNWLIMPL